MRFWGTTRPGPADVMTLGNATCGASAILVVMAYASRPVHELTHTGVRVVVLLLLVGTIFDSLDGRFARGGRGTRLGPMLDSLADAISFGLAPAALLAQVAMRGASPVEQLVTFAGFIVYVSGALLRLADFSSIRAGDPQFTGLPSPMGAVMLLSLALLTTNTLVIAVGMAVVGAMMVSRLVYPLQRGPVVALAGMGWVLGIAGTLGVYDVRIFAAFVLLVVGVVLPALPKLAPRFRPAI
ncbi:phosphatidylcholine/phosphatidylserine synthase [Nocardioides sp. LS1]|uniref:CDP-alcohol phosphatidyltransferase family protein n=1 Tax=Nocardioides sp. LS1 TaxID=1027620 RepID=UPI000F61EE31|nr:CDP-alcohol phosphatidyltransferase family protein [Nocardioides sp. LS1]GCD88863.1 CDP-diacylglycerol--serine O-phosphatidyltransferase [Nocardioides sp. LS1]